MEPRKTHSDNRTFGDADEREPQRQDWGREGDKEDGSEIVVVVVEDAREARRSGCDWTARADALFFQRRRSPILAPRPPQPRCSQRTVPPFFSPKMHAFLWIVKRVCEFGFWVFV